MSPKALTADEPDLGIIPQPDMELRLHVNKISGTSMKGDSIPPWDSILVQPQGKEMLPGSQKSRTQTKRGGQRHRGVGEEERPRKKWSTLIFQIS